MAHSHDGVVWFNHSVVMGPTTTARQPREDIACAAPVVWVDDAGVYRMVYVAVQNSGNAFPGGVIFHGFR